MSQNKHDVYEAQLKQLKDHFKKIKRITLILWIVYNIVADVAAFLIWHQAHIEITVFAIIISSMLSTLFMVGYLNRLDKIRVSQEMQLIEKAPLNKLRF